MGSGKMSQPAYTIKEWCTAARFSEALYFKLQRQGRGPKVAHVNKRAIVRESPDEYFDRHEREAAAQPRTGEAV
jgi:hypothetical protein